MTSHTLYPHIDPVLPSTLSKKTLSKLKENFNYKGILVTDDMLMGALNNFNSKEILALEAGNDMLLYVSDATRQITAMTSVLNKVNSDNDFFKDVKSKVKKILEYKEKYGLLK